MKKWLIAVLIILVLIIGAYFLFPKQSTQNTNLVQNNNDNSNNMVQTNNTPSNNNPVPSSNDVKISGFSFSPSSLTINIGESVTWTNEDSVNHIVVSDSGSEIKSTSLAQGQTYTHTFNSAGTYAYHCSIHPSMKGTIIVR